MYSIIIFRDIQFLRPLDIIIIIVTVVVDAAVSTGVLSSALCLSILQCLSNGLL